MSSTTSARVEPLNKSNYDTWKLQMQAILIKCDLWDFVDGVEMKPEPEEDNAAAIAEWTKKDLKARSEIILLIASSELRQVRNCNTAREMWLKLAESYESKGPARKAFLLKSVIHCKMADNADIREHVDTFFNVVDKLAEMDVDINQDLLSVLLLYSLPNAFENFRCAIESRDNLPSPDSLRVKILEESDARRGNTQDRSDDVMFVNKKFPRYQKKKPEYNKSSSSRKSREEKEFRCYTCKRLGHKSSECRYQDKKVTEKHVKNICLKVSPRNAVHHRGDWCLDSGATTHLCNEATSFSKLIGTKHSALNLANDTTTFTEGEGTAEFVTEVQGGKANVSLKNAFHVPDLRSNLMSVSKITDRGLEVIFRQNEAVVVDRKGEVQLHADRVGDLYFVRSFESDARAAHLASKTNKISVELLHRRLGHANLKDIETAVRERRIEGVQLENSEKKLNCDTCFQGKMSKAPFPKQSQRESDILDIIHTDLCGPMRTTSLGGARYYIEFIDDRSRWCEIRFLKTKAEAVKATIDYINFVEKQQDRHVKCLQSDNGTEFINRELDEYLKKKGITRRLTAPYNPQQNGVAERKNRTLLDTARCLLIESELPQSFWAEAVNTANYLRNRLPTKSLKGMTPYEAWKGIVPDVSNCRVFGSRVFFLDSEPGKGKFEARSLEGIFLGYANESKAYRIWSPRKRAVLMSRDVKFLDDVHQKVPRNEVINVPKECESQSLTPTMIEFDTPSEVTPENRESSDEGDFLESENTDSDVPADDPASTDVTNSPEGAEGTEDTDLVNQRVRAPGRPRIIRTGRRGRPKKLFRTEPGPSTTDDEATESANNIEHVFLSEIPMKKAMTSSDAEEWRDAIAMEMAAIIKNETFTLVDRKDRRTVGSRVVLRNKFKSDGSPDKKKARLVAQGFSQRPGVHFTETFAPVVRFSSFRLLRSLAATHGMKIHQYDIGTAYLNSEIEEDIYMEPPRNFEEILERVVENETGAVKARAENMLREIRKGDKVCHLRKSLYGLRQAGRNWYKKLSLTLREIGAVPTDSDPCFFRLGCGENAAFIAIYVDDILIASRDQRKITAIERELSSRFDVKRLGLVKHCLGVEFNLLDNTVTLNQRGYINELLSRFSMSECKPVSTPVNLGEKLLKKVHQSPDDAKLPYRELVGSLTYLASTTRPDIAFAASHLGQFNNCYGEEHWKAAKRVLRYLKGTIDLGLSYNTTPGVVEAFVDADWGSCAEDRRSYTGYIFLCSGGPIAWDAKKQHTVALSTTEAEYMALTECVKEAIYLQRFLREIGFSQLADLEILCDNRSAIKLAENPTFHARSKHIDIRHHFVRDVLRDKRVSVKHVSTDRQVADFLTKGLTKTKHLHCIESAGIKFIL